MDTDIGGMSNSFLEQMPCYWCLVGNGWEWNGIIIDSYCGSFPHSLLIRSKFCRQQQTRKKHETTCVLLRQKTNYQIHQTQHPLRSTRPANWACPTVQCRVCSKNVQGKHRCGRWSSHLSTSKHLRSCHGIIVSWEFLDPWLVDVTTGCC